jgi:hypothetical protein
MVMAGKKGMKQARPRTQEEKDKYALARIEELLDQAMEGKEIKKWNPIRMRAIEIRYNKLRASLSSTELTDKREGWVDVMKRLAGEKKAADPVVEPEEQRSNTPLTH